VDDLKEIVEGLKAMKNIFKKKEEQYRQAVKEGKLTFYDYSEFLEKVSMCVVHDKHLLDLITKLDDTVS